MLTGDGAGAAGVVDVRVRGGVVAGAGRGAGGADVVAGRPATDADVVIGATR